MRQLKAFDRSGFHCTVSEKNVLVQNTWNCFAATGILAQ